MKRIFFIIIAQLLFGLGLQAQTTQELRDSVKMIEGLIERHPKAVKLYLRKAALNISLEQWDKALEDYNEVLKMIGQPDKNTMSTYTTALYFRGYVYKHMRRYVLARNDYEAVLKVTPLDMHALMGLTQANMEDGRDTEAYDLANRLVEMFPDTAQVYALRCEVEQTMNLYDAALDDILKAAEIEKKTVEKRYPFEDDDDIISYELTAFNLYMGKEDYFRAKECLDYLSKHGTNRAYLLEPYMDLKKQKGKPLAKKYQYVITKKSGKKISFSSY